MLPFWPARCCLVVACALSLSAGLGAQAQPDRTVRCDAVLTADEAAAAAGTGYTGPAVDEPRPGFTRCEWQGEDTNFGFTFANLRALDDDQRPAAQEFEFEVSAVESDGHKRELLTDLGMPAALVALEGDAILLAVQRPDGVARMLAYKVPRDKVLALARAIATP